MRNNYVSIQPRFASLLTAAFINQVLQDMSGSTSVPRFPRRM